MPKLPNPDDEDLSPLQVEVFELLKAKGMDEKTAAPIIAAIGDWETAAADAETEREGRELES